MIERFWIMSIQAAVLITAVLLIRQLFKRCSKVYGYCLWMLVLLRLLCPVFIESKISLQPDFKDMENLLPGEGTIPQLSPASPVLEDNGTNPQTSFYGGSGRRKRIPV